MKKTLFAQWRANFVAGLAVLLPAVATLAIVRWLFGSVANVTDNLLFFVPMRLTHADLLQTGDARGPMFWYWSFVALLLAVVLVTLAGLLARYYFGRKLIEWMDVALLQVPLVNKIYAAIKQVNEAFTSNKRGSFKTVVLIEFPRPGMYSLGFLTSEQRAEVQAKTREKVVGVFVPTTPNPTSGFLVLVPEDKVTKLEMSVGEGIKYIVSLGAVAPPWSEAGGPIGPGGALAAPATGA